MGGKRRHKTKVKNRQISREGTRGSATSSEAPQGAANASFSFC
jgi:hypothetical protein